MGRRALRRNPANIDLTRHYTTVEKLPLPWNPAALFERDQSLEIEVGSGKGLFIADAASQRPNHNFMGIEVVDKYASHAAARILRRGLTNAVMVQGDALKVFREMVPDASLAAVHVYFPDPWWKARHRKRRVLNAAFLTDVRRTLPSGARMHFWTDVEEYYLSTLELLQEFPELRGPLPVDERPAEHDLDYLTHFERRTRRNGEPVYRSEFERT